MLDPPFPVHSEVGDCSVAALVIGMCLPGLWVSTDVSRFRENVYCLPCYLPSRCSVARHTTETAAAWGAHEIDLKATRCQRTFCVRDFCTPYSIAISKRLREIWLQMCAYGSSGPRAMRIPLKFARHTSYQHVTLLDGIRRKPYAGR